LKAPGSKEKRSQKVGERCKASSCRNPYRKRGKVGELGDANLSITTHSLVLILCTSVIPCQINTKNGHPLQISLKFDESKAPIEKFDHTKFWPHSSNILGFVVT
jgi:hypothetical protein